MIRVYFDSNVFRNLKQSSAQFNNEFYKIVELLKNKMLFIYSDAHLDDLRNSIEKFRNEDLNLMEQYVNDNYFYHNPIKKEFECLLATPTKAFSNKDYVAYDEALSYPFQFDNLFKDLNDDALGNAMQGLMDAFFKLPLNAFGNMPDFSTMDENSTTMLNKYIPNYNSNMSIGEFMHGISPYSALLLKDEDEVKDLRKYISNYMNRDDYSCKKWGYEFNENFKKSPVGKSYLEMIDSVLTENQKKDIITKFKYVYTQLEIFNITQERNSKGLKKFNLSSLNTDADHAYYTSFCDYLVTNYKGMQVKANITYQLLGFKTKVLSSQDFINLGQLLLGQEEDLSKFLTSFEYDLNKAFLLNKSTDIKTGITTFKYKTTHDYFNYFNRFQIIVEGNIKTYAFYCDRESHGNFYMYREIEIIVQKLIAVFGIDDEAKDEYNFEENDKWEAGDIIRSWTINKLKFELVTSIKTWGNFIVLTLNINE